MTQITISLPDEQIVALQAQAAACGLSLEQWFEHIASEEIASVSSLSAQAAVERILDVQKRVKPDPEGLTIHDYINQNRP